MIRSNDKRDAYIRIITDVIANTHDHQIEDFFEYTDQVKLAVKSVPDWEMILEDAGLTKEDLKMTLSDEELDDIHSTFSGYLEYIESALTSKNLKQLWELIQTLPEIKIADTSRTRHLEKMTLWRNE